jgi:hypothetical protein
VGLALALAFVLAFLVQRRRVSAARREPPAGA